LQRSPPGKSGGLFFVARCSIVLIYMNRISAWRCWRVAVVSGGMVLSAIKSQGQPHDDKQSHDVYRVVFDELFFSQEEHAEIIVVNDSVFRFGGAKSWLGEPDRYIDFKAGPMKETFPADFNYRIPVVRSSESERRKMGGDQSPAKFWAGFSRSNPKAWGLTTLSEVAFSRAGDKALVFVVHSCSDLCLSEETIRLERSGGRWKVVERLMTEGANSAGNRQGNMRSLWPDMQVKAESVIFASDSAWIADSIAFARAPSFISGKLAHTATGRPIAGAQIVTTVREGRGPSTVTDSLGRFRFDLHPTNVFYEIFCPRMPTEQKRVLDGGGFWPAAADTGFTITIGDMSPCWGSRRAMSVTTGELDTPRYLDSPIPDLEEANVYLAVVAGIGRTGEPIVLRPMQAASCLHDDVRCGLPELSLLYVEGRVDSTAIRSLTAGRVASDPFNSRFARANGISLLTEGEEQYLRSEASGGADLASAAIQAHPGARGITSLSAVAFDERRERALVQVRRERPDSLNAVTTMLVVKRGTGWRVDVPVIEREPLSGRYAGNACRPARMQDTTAASTSRAFSGRYSFELVSATGAAAPTRSFHVGFKPRGVDSTGVQRAPLFQVFDPVSGRRDEFTESGLSIRSGSLEFQRLTAGMRTHGEGYVLDVLEARDGQIFGSWRYYYGPFVNKSKPRRAEPAGYFCARVLAEPGKPPARVASRLPN
jgi:hypothetical protein